MIDLDSSEILSLLSSPSHTGRSGISRVDWVKEVLEEATNLVETRGIFQRSDIRALIESKFPDYCIGDIRRKASQLILKLKETHKITKEKRYRTKSYLKQVKELRSMDYDSYEILMQRNGYKNSKFYIYERFTDIIGKKGIRKRCIGIAPYMSDKYYQLLDECDEVQRVSYKKKSLQGCYGLTGNFSWSMQKMLIGMDVFVLEGEEPSFSF